MKKKKTIITIGLITVLLCIIGVSYAYFTATINKEGDNTVNIKTSALANATMEMGNKIEASGVLPGYKVVKTVRVYGSGPENAKPINAVISLIPNVTDFSNHIEYEVYALDNPNGIDTTKICSESNKHIDNNQYYDEMTCDTSNLGEKVTSGTFYQINPVKIDIEVGSNTDKTYYILVKYVNDESNPQDQEQGKKFTINIDFKEPVKGMMMARDDNYAFWQSQYGGEITKIVIEPKIEAKVTDEYWDISNDKDGSVMAYLVDSTLYIQGNGKVIAPEDSSSLFSIYEETYLGGGSYDQVSVLEKIEGLEYLDTSNVTNMSDMFSNCRSLTSLNLSNFDTSNVIDMSGMFFGCDSLTSLNLSNFDTSNVRNMSSMFNSCRSLTSLDVSSFDTSNVTNMGGMFSYCSSLTSLDVSRFDTSNVIDMNGMFLGCNSLTSLDVSNFDTRNVTNMGGMFLGCNSLTSLNLSNFDTRNVTDMRSMFNRCSSLTSLNISNFDTSDVIYMSDMFSDCNNLTTISYGNSFIHKPEAGISNMFYNCPANKPTHSSWNSVNWQ